MWIVAIASRETSGKASARSSRVSELSRMTRLRETSVICLSIKVFQFVRDGEEEIADVGEFPKWIVVELNDADAGGFVEITRYGVLGELALVVCVFDTENHGIEHGMGKAARAIFCYYLILAPAVGFEAVQDIREILAGFFEVFWSGHWKVPFSVIRALTASHRSLISRLVSMKNSCSFARVAQT